MCVAVQLIAVNCREASDREVAAANTSAMFNLFMQCSKNDDALAVPAFGTDPSGLKGNIKWSVGNNVTSARNVVSEKKGAAESSKLMQSRTVSKEDDKKCRGGKSAECSSVDVRWYLVTIDGTSKMQTSSTIRLKLFG